MVNHINNVVIEEVESARSHAHRVTLVGINNTKNTHNNKGNIHSNQTWVDVPST